MEEASDSKYFRIHSREDGFTLIELLVVIIIIGILAAIAIPAFLGFQAQAREAKTKSDVRNTVTQVLSLSANQGSLPGTVGEKISEGDFIIDSDGDDSAHTTVYTRVDGLHFTVVGTVTSDGFTFSYDSRTQKFVEGKVDAGTDNPSPDEEQEVAPTVVLNEPTVTNLQVDFSATASGKEGDTFTYVWTFEEGGEKITTQAPTTSHTYSKTGVYQVSVVAVNSKNVESTPATKQVSVKQVNTAPTAVITSTSNGMDLNFNGTSSSDAEQDVLSYAWDFGDGKKSTSSSGTHTYENPGSYTVSLTVSDPDGLTSISTKTVAAVRLPLYENNFDTNRSRELAAAASTRTVYASSSKWLEVHASGTTPVIQVGLPALTVPKTSEPKTYIYSAKILVPNSSPGSAFIYLGVADKRQGSNFGSPDNSANPRGVWREVKVEFDHSGGTIYPHIALESSPAANNIRFTVDDIKLIAFDR